MNRVVFNITNAKKNSKYPSHGWLLTDQNIKLLYFPIFDLFRYEKIDGIRSEKGWKKMKKEDVNNLENILQKFRVIISRLIVSLQEINKYNRLIDQFPGFEALTNEQHAEIDRYLIFINIFADISVIYLRRLADIFAKVLRFIVADRYDQVPKGFRDLYKKVNSYNKNNEGNFNFDVSSISEIFKEKNLKWFDELAMLDKDAYPYHGIRDKLEHRDAFITTSINKVGDNPHQFCIQVRDMQGMDIRDKFKEIKFGEIVGNFCQFLTEACKKFLSNSVYNQYNSIIINLSYWDEDVVSSWPQIL